MTTAFLVALIATSLIRAAACYALGFSEYSGWRWMAYNVTMLVCGAWLGASVQ